MNFFCKLFSYSFSRLSLSLACSVSLALLHSLCSCGACWLFVNDFVVLHFWRHRPFFAHTHAHTLLQLQLCVVCTPSVFLYLILYSSALLLLSLSVVAGARHKHHVRTYYLYSSQINPFNMLILLQCSLNASLLHDRHKILCLCKVSRL